MHSHPFSYFIAQFVWILNIWKIHVLLILNIINLIFRLQPFSETKGYESVSSWSPTTKNLQFLISMFDFLLFICVWFRNCNHLTGMNYSLIIRNWLSRFLCKVVCGLEASILYDWTSLALLSWSWSFCGDLILKK